MVKRLLVSCDGMGSSLARDIGGILARTTTKLKIDKRVVS